MNIQPIIYIAMSLTIFATTPTSAMRQASKVLARSSQSDIGIWHLAKDTFISFEEQDPPVAPQAQSITLLQMQRWFAHRHNERVDFDFSQAVDEALSIYQSKPPQRARKKYIRFIKHLIEQEHELSGSHDIFYHGTQCLGAMILRKHLLAQATESPLVFRNPEDCERLKSIDNIASYVKQEAHTCDTINWYASIHDRIPTLYRNVDQREEFAKLLLSVNPSACGNVGRDGESSLNYLLPYPEEALTDSLKDISLCILLFPLTVPMWCAIKCQHVIQQLRREIPSSEKQFHDILRAYGCSQEFAMRYAQELEKAQAHLSQALIRIALPRELRSSWYFAHPWGEPVCQGDSGNESAREEMLTKNSSQVRIRTDILDKVDADLRIQVYSVGSQKNLNDSIHLITQVAQKAREEVPSQYINSSSKKEGTTKMID